MNVITVALAMVSTTALAQEEEGGRERIIREVERGPYVKANIGGNFLLGIHGQTRGPQGSGSALFSGVVASSLGIGADFIDRERFSAAFEVQLTQGLYNGPRIGEIENQTLAQGDIHTIGALATVEASTYLTRRFGIGVRGGAGIVYFPLLVNRDAYFDQLVGDIGQNTDRGAGEAELHANGTYVALVAGPTFEYYTKLAHFSIGVDADVMFMPGFDLGIYPSGYLKYTF